MSAQALVTDDGIRIAWEEHGPQEGLPIVLCHGLAASGRQFAADARFFADRGYRVLVPDLRGHGQSGKAAAATPANYALARLGHDLLQLLEVAGADRVHWVGNSLGGLVALAMLPAARGRFRTLTTFGAAYALHLPAIVARAIPLFYRFPGRHISAAITALTTTRDPAGRRLLARVLRAYDPQVGHAVAANLTDYDLTAKARETDVPILLLRCGRDVAINRALPETLDALAGAAHVQVRDIPRGGHCANLDATEDVRAALLDFWAEH